MDDFADILAPRRSEPSTVVYFLGEHYGKPVCKQEGPTRPETHKLAVLGSRKIKELIERVSAENGVAREEVERRVRELLEEIGYKRSLRVIKTLGVVLTKILLRTCKGVFVNERRLLEIKESFSDVPVVLVPTHRSYADFILMTFLFYTYDIAIPTTAAGMDFQGMLGMGEMLRQTGAFFMRRSFGADRLYATVFKQYVHQLVTKNDDPVQFFVEGTRSRSGKSISPKFGLMLMTLKPFFTGEVYDITFLPMHTTYDRILEEKLFAFELLGVPKPKETTSGFIKSLKIINENYGNVYMNFGKPVSAREYFSDKIVRKDHNLKPLHEQELTTYEKKLVAQFAYEIIYRQQKLTIITTFSLIALCLTYSIKSSIWLTLDTLSTEVLWYKGLLENLGAKTDIRDAKENIVASMNAHTNLVRFRNGKLELCYEKVVLDNFNKNLLKGHNLSEETMTKAVPLVMLQVYVNPALHFLLNPMLLVSAFKSGKSLSRNELQDHYIFLRTIFSSEFVVLGQIKEWEFDEAMNQTKDLKVLAECEADIFTCGSNGKLVNVLESLLEPFLYSYYTVCTVLLNGEKKWTEKMLFAEVQAVLENRIHHKDIFVHPYVLSLDAIKNCFTSLIEMKAISKRSSNASAVYMIDKESLSITTLRLGNFILESQRSSSHIQLKNKL